MDSRITVPKNELQRVNQWQLYPETGEALSLIEIWRVLFKRAFVILGVFVLTVAATAVYTLRKVPMYEAVSRVQIDPNRATNIGLQGVIEEKLSFGDGSERLQTEVLILQSDSVLMQVIKQLDLPNKAPYSGIFKGAAYSGGEFSPAQRAQLLGALKSGLRVQIQPNTNLVDVRFRHADPKLATEIDNKIVEAYLDRALDSRFQGTTRVSDWLSKQISALKTQATTAQQALVEFQKRNDLLGTDETDNLVTEKLRHINQQLTEAEADRVMKEARFRLATTRNPELISSVAPTPALHTMRTQQAELRLQLGQLTSKYGSGYPKVRELEMQLQKLETSINGEITIVGKRLEEEYLAAQKSESMLRARLSERCHAADP